LTRQQTLPGQVLSGQRWSEIRITLPQARQNLLLQPGRQLAVRWPTTQSVNQTTIPSFAKTEQYPPHLAVGYFKPLGCCYLRQVLLLYLVQHFQAVPFSLAQSDSLRFHGALGPP
jgi:hypothetical protein